MTPTQRHLARNALGLPSDAGRSYRNRFYVSPGTDGHGHWQAMAAQGWAIEHPRDGTLILFTLTRAGAELALEPGETLCGEDFPEGTDNG